MPSLNKVFLMGNLTCDPELRYTPGGTAVCEFTLAINRKWTGKDGQKHEDTCFAGVTAWERKAEVVCEFCHKGDPLLVEGRLSQENWEDKDGKKQTKTKVVMVEMYFVGGGRGKSEQVARPTAAPDADEIDDGGIPF